MQQSEYKTLYEAMPLRKSIRQYDDQYPTDEQCDLIDQFINKINEEEDTLFHTKCRFALMRKDFSRIYTFGFIGGYKYWLCGVCEKNNADSEISFGNKFEKIILYITSLGLSTVWLGATFITSWFTEAINYNPEQDKILCVSPVGNKTKGWEGLTTFVTRRRYEWNNIFFKEDKSEFKKEDCNEIITEEFLERIRWAPSAMNAQEWRFIINGNKIEVYFAGGMVSSLFGRCDVGISMAHIEIGTKATGHSGRWENENKQQEGWTYVSTWIIEN